MDETTVVVIGQKVCDTSRGCLAVGEYARLPIVEALQLQTANMVSLAEWNEQGLEDPAPSRRGRYQRRDMQAEP